MAQCARKPADAKAFYTHCAIFFYTIYLQPTKGERGRLLRAFYLRAANAGEGESLLTQRRIKEKHPAIVLLSGLVKKIRGSYRWVFFCVNE